MTLFVGDDRRLSSARADVEEIIQSRRFSEVYYEAMDIRVPGVRAIPMGFNQLYMLKIGLKNVAEVGENLGFWRTPL